MEHNCTKDVTKRLQNFKNVQVRFFSFLIIYIRMYIIFTIIVIFFLIKAISFINRSNNISKIEYSNKKIVHILQCSINLTFEKELPLL